MENGTCSGFWVIQGVSVDMGGTSSAGLLPHVQRAWATQVCLSLNTLWTEVGEGVIFAAFWEFTGFPRHGPCILGTGGMAEGPFTDVQQYLQLYFALCACLSESAQSPWLLCVYGNEGSRGTAGNCRKTNGETFFSLSVVLEFCYLDTSGWKGQGTLGPAESGYCG